MDIQSFMHNCIKITPVTSKGFDLKSYPKSTITNLPFPEMDTFIREQAKRKSGEEICVAIVTINTEATIYSQSDSDGYYDLPILFNAVRAGKSRQIYDVRTRKLLAEPEHYDGDFDFTTISGYCTDYCEYPGLRELHEQAIAAKKSQVALSFMDGDETVEVLDTVYYKKQLKEVTTVTI